MNLFKSPEESLHCYFDELLCESSWEPESAPAPQEAKIETAKTDLIDQAEAYIESIKKQQLEKLLRAAQSQTLVGSNLQASPTAQPKGVTVEKEPVIEKVVVAPKELHRQPFINHSQPEKVSHASPANTSETNLKPSFEHLEKKPERSLEKIEITGVKTQKDASDWQENGRPEWAQQQFDVLLFTVSGLQLAVPLIALGQIQPITEELTPLFGQADWFMGLQPTPQGHIRTVNTAKFVMPERYDARFVETAKYVVSINGVPWGLAVDAVHQPITLNPDDVRWRTDRTKRVWLAGTVKEHMCALLDIPRMGQLLQSTDKNVVA